jgi:hypothetical protein
MALNECRSFRLRVDRVTNTNDSGPGSLRDALYNLTDTRFQVILFETGGTIELSDRLELRNDCVYLAGQTAPGDGILLKGNGLRVFNTRDVVIRYVRIRDATNNLDITDTGGTRRIVVDHVSTTWGTDGNFGIWRTERSAPDTREITFQRSISAEVLAGHSAGFLIGGRGSERAHEGVYDISIHHNLFAHTGQRNPEVISGSAQERIDRGTEIVNNVQYNWLGRPISTRRNSVVDILNNFSKPGPMSAILVHRHAFYDSDLADVFADPSLFAQGNVMAGEHFADQWQMFRDWYALDETLPDRFRRTDPLPKAPFPVSVHSAEAAFESVLGDVGASARLDCDGNWIPAHDPIDLRILTDVLAGTGYSEAPPESPDEAGGWPIMSEGQRCQDSDSDGLPDQWEARFTPCPTCADPAAAGRDGYLWIEHYLNGSDPR